MRCEEIPVLFSRYLVLNLHMSNGEIRERGNTEGQCEKKYNFLSCIVRSYCVTKE